MSIPLLHLGVAIALLGLALVVVRSGSY